ncbi:outer membrane beta-barrel protein [Phormidium sp. FACHB-592]|uniref:Outer membrane beta-barrel protein n=1 Tax=Stenomitos frigidus AS-A4 TaxID=2933935 RepID=A0ABV0KPM9_9CYAN|nr:outer membrane beta-barrel protein [Phormidium sp. FACHB-592]MBD2072439.1 outer membrane beta-barrel protein [Phormidium sp. FACHB-592]
MATWQQLIIWSSVLLSSPAWSTPQPPTYPTLDTDAVPMAPQDSIAVVSPHSSRQLPTATASSPVALPQLEWSTPQPSSIRSTPDTDATPRAGQSSIAVVSSRSSRQLPPATASSPVALPQLEQPHAQRNRAAALLPLQPVQDRLAAETAESVTSFAFSEPTTVMEKALAGVIAQSNSPSLAQSDSNPPTSVFNDPELGVLRLQVPKTQQSGTSADGTSEQQAQTAARCASGVALDPELGCLPIQTVQPPPPSRQPLVYLVGRLDYFRSSNVFSAIDPVDDGLFRPGLTLFTAPALGRNTYFIGAIDGNLIRYNTQSQIDYNELQFRAGIFQRLSPTMFGEIGWTNQQLFIAGSKIPGLPIGTRFLNDHAVRLELSRRDQLNKRLLLSTFYQLRLSFADPDSRSRVLNSFIASLSYNVQPNLQVGLDYQFALANFTAIRRDDEYHQLAARLTYTAFRNTQLNMFVGYSFGNSTDPAIEFNSLILGVSLSVNLGLF